MTRCGARMVRAHCACISLWQMRDARTHARTHARTVKHTHPPTRKHTHARALVRAHWKTLAHNYSATHTRACAHAGFAMAYPDGVSADRADGGKALYFDLLAIFRALHAVTNNAPESIGGGGTPRVPKKPPICGAAA